MTALSSKRVKALLDQGKTTPEIAALLMTSFQSVEEIARSLRPISPTPPAPPQGVLSTQWQATRQAVRSLRRKSEPRSPVPAGVEVLGEREGRTASPKNLAQVEEQLGQALSAALLRKEGVTRGAKEPKGCRFVIGDVSPQRTAQFGLASAGSDWRYCQERPADGSSYCATHHRKTHYRPSSPAGRKPGA